MGEVILDPAAIDELLKSKNGPVGRWLAATAQKVTNEAKRRSPVDTGRLRASIAWQLLEDSDGVFARVGTDVNYAPFVHEGTRYMRGRPFIEEALQKVLGSR